MAYKICLFVLVCLCLIVYFSVHVYMAYKMCSSHVTIKPSDPDSGPEHCKIIFCSIFKRLQAVLPYVSVFPGVSWCVFVCAPVLVFLCFK